MKQDPKVLLKALEGVSPSGLRAAAEHLPPALSGRLSAVADALEAEDPEAALAAVMAGESADPGEIDRVLVVASTLVGDQLTTISDTATQAGSAVDALDAERARIASVVPAVDDAELAALLDRALKLAGDEAPIRAVRSALAESRALADVARDLLEGARRDPSRAAHAQATLQARIRGLERALGDAQTAAANLTQVPALVAELRSLATARGQLTAAAELATIEAGLFEQLRGLGDADAVLRWNAAFEEAIRGESVAMARAASQRLQLVALQRGDFSRVAVLAHRVADLARAKGDLRAEILSRLEEVLALGRIPAHHADARGMAADVVALAETSPESFLRARARLTHGQLLEQLGDAAEARRVYRAILASARSDASFPREVGRAALHLGRLELGHQPGTARRDLGLARAIGLQLGEWLLYAPAALALLEYYADHDDRAELGPLLRAFAQDAPRLGGSDGQRAFEHVVGELAARWGRPAVEALLAA